MEPSGQNIQLLIICDSLSGLLPGETGADKIIVAPNTLEFRLDLRDILQPVRTGTNVVVGQQGAGHDAALGLGQFLISANLTKQSW